MYFSIKGLKILLVITIFTYFDDWIPWLIFIEANLNLSICHLENTSNKFLSSYPYFSAYNEKNPSVSLPISIQQSFPVYNYYKCVSLPSKSFVFHATHCPTFNKCLPLSHWSLCHVITYSCPISHSKSMTKYVGLGDGVLGKIPWRDYLSQNLVFKYQSAIMSCYFPNKNPCLPLGHAPSNRSLCFVSSKAQEFSNQKKRRSFPCLKKYD